MAELRKVTGNPFESGRKPKLVKVAQDPFQKEKDWRNTAAEYYRPALEAGASMAGGIVGTSAGPFGIVAGGALGYAAGDKAADIIDEAIGLSEPSTVKESLADTGKALKTGVEWEGVGMLLPAIVKPIWKSGKWVFTAARSKLTGGGMKKDAATRLVAQTSGGNIYAENAEQAQKLEADIPGLKFTTATQRNDPSLIMAERGAARANPQFANEVLEQSAANDAAIAKYYDANFGQGPGLDDVGKTLAGKGKALEGAGDAARQSVGREVSALDGRTQQELGQDIVGSINKASAPVKKAMGLLEDSIPEYPMSFSTTKGKLSSLAKDPKMSSSQKQAVGEVSRQINEILRGGKSTFSAVGVRRTLNDIISKNFASGNGKVAAPLMDVVSALDDDLAKVSELARTGKMSTHKGQPVDTDRIASEFERNAQKIAELKATTTPDVAKMRQELTAMGKPAMPVVAESEKAYAERLSKEYQKFIGAPPTAKTGGDTVKELIARNEKISGILADVQPGQDVGAAMNAYNKYASQEYFPRFGKGATKTALAKGNQATGTRLKPEDIPKMFASQSGADDLIRAVGQDEAKALMKDHVANDLLKHAIDQQTGLISIPKLNRWKAKNNQLLGKLGLDNIYKNAETAQQTLDGAKAAIKDFQKSAAAKVLNADPEKAIAKAFSGGGSYTFTASKLLKDVSGSPEAVKGLRAAFADFVIGQAQTTAKNIEGGKIISNAAMVRVMNKYSPAMKVLYKDAPQQYNALKNIQRAIEIGTRTKKSPLGGGSDTSENIASMLKNLPSWSATFNYAKQAISFLNKLPESQVQQYLNRALVDPDYAQTLMAIGKPKQGKAAFIKMKGQVVNLERYKLARDGQIAASVGLAINQDDSTRQ
jgi:hypothetical protein